MATTDETELSDEFMQTWEDLETTLLRAALVLDFRGNLSQVLDFLKRNGVIYKNEWAKLVLYQGTRSEILEGGADYGYVLTRAKVDEFVSLAARLGRRLQSFLSVGLEVLEAQKGQAEGTAKEREIADLVKRQAEEKPLSPLEDDDPFWDVDEAYLDELRSRVEAGLREDED